MFCMSCQRMPLTVLPGRAPGWFQVCVGCAAGLGCGQVRLPGSARINALQSRCPIKCMLETLADLQRWRRPSPCAATLGPTLAPSTPATRARSCGGVYNVEDTPFPCSAAETPLTCMHGSQADTVSLACRKYDLPPTFGLCPGVDDCIVHFFCMYCASHQVCAALLCHAKHFA